MQPAYGSLHLANKADLSALFYVDTGERTVRQLSGKKRREQDAISSMY